VSKKKKMNGGRGIEKGLGTPFGEGSQVGLQQEVAFEQRKHSRQRIHKCKCPVAGAGLGMARALAGHKGYAGL
jgi:hypothetical protein